MRKRWLFSFYDAKNSGCFMEGKRAYIERRNRYESYEELDEQTLDLGDLL